MVRRAQEAMRDELAMGGAADTAEYSTMTTRMGTPVRMATPENAANPEPTGIQR